MPLTHEELEHLVIAGLNFKNAYERLRREVRIKHIELSTDPEWERVPHHIKAKWLAIHIIAEDPPLTIVEDATLLATKQKHYISNRRGNFRRREYQRLRRYDEKQAISPPSQSLSSASFMTPEQASSIDDIASQNAEIDRLLEEARLAQQARTEEALNQMSNTSATNESNPPFDDQTSSFNTPKEPSA